MTVPTIALYASPPSSVCSASHQIPPHASLDFDLGSRTTSSASASPSQRPFTGGLSRMFSSSPVKSSASYSTGTEEFGSSWHDSPLSSSLKREQAFQSPVSVLQGPNSFTESPNLRIGADFGSGRRNFGSYANQDSFSNLALEMKRFDLSNNGEELTFNMEDDFEELDLPPYAKDLLYYVQSRHSIFGDEFVVKAFREAEKAHRGQKRASGKPYLQHCVETAVLLAEIGANSTVVAAGLLQDSVDDSFLTYDHLSSTVGAGVADLVEGVSKLSHLSKLARDNNIASRTTEADRLHTMFLAMADARAVLIKLADRLHNMMTLDALPLIKQQRFAKETLEIFAPLANRLGISTWKEQLENLCFKYLNPDQHQELSSKIPNSFDEALVTCSVEKLEQSLKAGGVSYLCLSGRNKSLYSIYSKMSKKKLNMEQIHDIHGLRLIVETEEDCYKALKIVRQLWDEVPGRCKDYIAQPKFNGYQSLHTIVVGEGMVPLEVQIRTNEMHLQAEYGFAAHWRYKEGDCKHFPFVLRMVEWARWVLTWQCETMRKDHHSVGFVGSEEHPCTFPTHSEDCTYSCKPYCGSDGPIFIIVMENDKMFVQEIPVNSSLRDVLDKASRGSSRLILYGDGFPAKVELRPTLNHESVSDLSCILKMGDVVELTPAKSGKSLTKYREEIKRMYERDLTTSSPVSRLGAMASLSN